MRDLSTAAPGMVRQAIQVIKVTHSRRVYLHAGRLHTHTLLFFPFRLQSIKTLQRQAEGLCEILNMKPSPATLEVHREVFGPDSKSDAGPPSVGGASGCRQPIKRAVEEEAAASGYVPLSKKPVD